MKTWCSVLVALAMSGVLSSCGGGGDGGNGGGGHGTPPDLAGVWAGNWQGADPALGEVTGTWQATVNPAGTNGVAGSGFLTGDVDCMDGTLSGSASENNYTGTVNRSPCMLNEWQLRALSSQDEMASGSWTQRSTNAKGTFSGIRIARVGGPRIDFVHPASAAPGAVVTIVGSGFDAASAGSVRFGDASLPAAPLITSSTTLTVLVPNPAYTAPVAVTTTTGSRALSPRAFVADVTAPAPILAATVATSTPPRALTFSRDGHKLYVVNAGSVGLLATQANTTVIPTGSYPSRVTAAPLGVAATANGRRVYVAAGTAGIVAADAALLQPVSGESITGFATAMSATPGTAALALSPDGARLYVADNLAGGVLRIIDLGSRTFTTSQVMGTGLLPVCVAVSPDGALVLLGVRDPAGVQSDFVAVLDPLTGLVTGATIPLGLEASPVAITFSQDGTRAYVSNHGLGTVAVIDPLNRSVVSTLTGFQSPTGLALAPDGQTLLVASEADDHVTFIDLSTQERRVVPVVLPGVTRTGPVAVAVSPEGSQAYVALGASNAIVELGNSAALTIRVAGQGIGTVTSSPPGVQCGTACRARFAIGTRVALSVQPGFGSQFGGWSGSGCGSGSVTLARPGVTCTASFDNVSASTGSSGGSGCFIATAAYGSAMAPQVAALREFRDRYLVTNAPGRAFVQWYYEWSPGAAALLRGDETLRGLARAGLWPAVAAITHPASFGSAVALLLWLGVSVRRWHHRAQRGEPCSDLQER
jgi:YVTN family beta-propeller protein